VLAGGVVEGVGAADADCVLAGGVLRVLASARGVGAGVDAV
jgi:hypothetical protein